MKRTQTPDATETAAAPTHLTLHSQEATKKVVVNFDFHKTVRQIARPAQDLADEAVCPRESGVDSRADADQTSGNCKLQRVRLREERHDRRDDGAARQLGKKTQLAKTNASQSPSSARRMRRVQTKPLLPTGTACFPWRLC